MTCTYPHCKCIVSTSTSQPIPECPREAEYREARRQENREAEERGVLEHAAWHDTSAELL